MQETEHLKILVLTPSIPYPPVWGFGMRVYQLLRYLSARHQVSLLTYTEPKDSDGIRVLSELGIQVHAVPKASGENQRRMGQAVSLLSPRSYNAQMLRSHAMQTTLDRLLATERFDILQIESSQMSGFNFGSRATVVLDEHNIEYELLYRMCRTERSPLRKLYNWAEYLKFRREERRAWRKADGCALTSAREERILRGYEPEKATAVVPNGVDIEYFAPRAEAVSGERIVFTGLMRYRPNIDAAIYFAREILPTILLERPNATFVIVGAGPTEEVQRLAGPGVQVTGTVPDVRPYVDDAAVLVVPLRMGSGTRLKVLEGLAMGKALVSTSLGCEGIEVQHNEHLLVADEPEEFARAVLQLLDHRELAAKLGERGRRLAEVKYAWTSIGAELERFHLQVCRPKTKTGLVDLVASRAAD